MVHEWNGELDARRSEVIVNARLCTRLSCQRRHSFDIPCHGYKFPLAINSCQAAQQELPEAHYRFNDAEHWLYGLLTQAVELAPLSRLEPMLHPVHCAGRRIQRWRLSESILPMRVMSIAPCRKQRLDLRRHATVDIRRTEESVVGQQTLHATQLLRQVSKRFEH